MRLNPILLREPACLLADRRAGVVIERHVDRDRFLAAVSDVTTIARGPKPVAVLKEFGFSKRDIKALHAAKAV